MVGKLEKLGGLDYLCEQVAAGRTVSAIARETLRVSNGQLYLWINEDPGRREAVARARRIGAGAHADAALTAAEGVATKEDALRARLVTDVRMRLASAFDRETYGERKDVNVALNVTTLHLDALRLRPYSRPDENALPTGQMGTLAAGEEIAQVVDVIEDTNR